MGLWCRRLREGVVDGVGGGFSAEDDAKRTTFQRVGCPLSTRCAFLGGASEW